MVNWSGVLVSHPDRKKVRSKVESDESLISSIDDNVNPEDFYDILLENQKANDTIDINSSDIISKAIFSYPVSNSDWLVNANINATKALAQVKNIKNRFYTIFIIMGFIIILTSVITVRLIGSFYEKQLEGENKKLEEEVISLAKLNKAIDKFQQKASQDLENKQKEFNEKLEAEKKKEKESKNSSSESKETESKNKEKGKKRILTYIRNEILTVNTEDIAYIYTENTITYVVRKDGKRSTTSESLDQVYSYLSEKSFFRANRQIIVAISAIDKITKFGNSKLKIQVNPTSEIDIIIGKNKAAAFKQWLDL